MKWIEEDTSLLLSAVDELSAYLASPVMDWNISSSRFVLNPGRILLALKRLSVIKNSDPKVRQLIETIGKQLELNSFHWRKKVDQEIPRRLKIWQNELMDFQEEGLDQSFKAQIVNRVMLQLLELEAHSLPPGYEAQIDNLDNELKMMAKRGNFIWDELLKNAFPPDEYWFLNIEI